MFEISSLSPAEVWSRFEEITKIPRPSKKEGKILAYLIDFAKKHNLEYRQDEIGNVVILKPATKGYEDHPTIVLQSHVDMVCEKNSGVAFDFDKDPIKAYVADGWVRAHGTTLGADCGIGMAAELAVLASSDVKHPSLEALFTVDEETGLTGAFELGTDMLSGEYLINLDSEDEGEIFIGCAGGIDTLAEFDLKTEPAPKNYVFFRIDFSGLKGGHSGDDIEKGGANSNKLLNRFLWSASREFEMRLSYIDGGNLRNAIPREAFAVFGVPVKDVKDMMTYFEEFSADIKAEYVRTEPSMDIFLSEMSAEDKVFIISLQEALLDAICGLPNGVIAMSQTMIGLVETSTNLASVKVSGHKIVVTTSQRSSLESARNATAAAVESVFLLAGASVMHSEGYPGWNPNPDSKLLELTKASYKELFGVEPKVRAIHAGLECGLFLEKYPWLEMVSFGPTLRGVHSPDEHLDIASVDKFWKLLKEVISKI